MPAMLLIVLKSACCSWIFGLEICVRCRPPPGIEDLRQTIDRHAAGRAANPVVLLAARVSLSQLRTPQLTEAATCECSAEFLASPFARLFALVRRSCAAYLRGDRLKLTGAQTNHPLVGEVGAQRPPARLGSRCRITRSSEPAVAFVPRFFSVRCSGFTPRTYSRTL